VLTTLEERIVGPETTGIASKGSIELLEGEIRISLQKGVPVDAFLMFRHRQSRKGFHFTCQLFQNQTPTPIVHQF
jgi:hypothetical protein